MAVSLLVVAGLIFAGLLGLFPLGGDAMGLTGYKLGIALLGNFIFGVLMNVGIGLFAPCMTLVYLLGMNPLAAFPIMMGSTAVLSVFSAGTFIRKGAFDAKAVLAVAIFGPVGVVLAAMLVKSMDMAMLKWLVAFIVIYTSWTMYASWQAARAPRPGWQATKLAGAAVLAVGIDVIACHPARLDHVRVLADGSGSHNPGWQRSQAGLHQRRFRPSPRNT
jgi:hypothetical protein